MVELFFPLSYPSNIGWGRSIDNWHSNIWNNFKLRYFILMMIRLNPFSECCERSNFWKKGLVWPFLWTILDLLGSLIEHGVPDFQWHSWQDEIYGSDLEKKILKVIIYIFWKLSQIEFLNFLGWSRSWRSVWFWTCDCSNFIQTWTMWSCRWLYSRG